MAKKLLNSPESSRIKHTWTHRAFYLLATILVCLESLFSSVPQLLNSNNIAETENRADELMKASNVFKDTEFRNPNSNVSITCIRPS